MEFINDTCTSKFQIFSQELYFYKELKRPTCIRDVKNSQLGIDLPASVNDRMISLFAWVLKTTAKISEFYNYSNK